MATEREHFALDWIKADLLETLNDARVALDDYAEQAGDETRMRACLTGLHQVHGTLVMLELKGVTQLADHLEQLAQAMLGGQVTNTADAGQALMQGILELPGYLDELQRGAEDNVSTSMELVNEIRGFLKQEPLADPAGGSLREGASDAAIARFNAIGGPDKVARIRSAYQNVLLSILKGEDRNAAVGRLGKIAVGLGKVTEGAPLERQWQAFGEFVASLSQQTGVLDSDAVKLLRRVDVEIKNLAKKGEAALRRPVNMDLVRQLLDGAVEREHNSPAVVGLQEAISRDVSNNTLAISGRQAMGSAASALQEDLLIIKDKLDLLVRANSVDLEELRHLVTPLKQIGSTLSLLGFESSREMISDQVTAIERLVVLGDGDPQGLQSIAAALVQIDENLSSVVLGSGQTEVEQITSEAQLQVLREARKDLSLIKQCVVDFVTTHWSVGHLEPVPVKLSEICGALEIIPLKRAIGMLQRTGSYVETQLMNGHRPDWQELDRFADVVSALDYYLERLAGETSSGADDILVVAERSLAELEDNASSQAPEVVTQQTAAPQAETPEAETQVEAPQTVEGQAEAPAEVAEQVDDVEIVEAIEVADLSDEAADAISAAASEELLDTENLPEIEEPKLELEEDPGFDLSSDVFADLEGTNDGEVTSAESSHDEPLVADLPVDEEPIDVAPNDKTPVPVLEPEPIAFAQASHDAALDLDKPIPYEVPAEQPEAVETATELERPDPEIVEIFVEEIDEVLENVAEYLPQWAQNFDNIDAQTEVRRGFHTLKGSGRIVSAVAIGELAWGIENMLNRVIDGTVTATPDFITVIDAALSLVPSLRDAFAVGEQGDLNAISVIVDQADVLSSGGELDMRALATAAVATGQPREVAPELPHQAQADQEQADPEEVLEMVEFEVVEPPMPAADEDIVADLPQIEASEGEQASEAEAEFEHEAELTTLDLFILEAREHLAVLETENARQPWTLSEPIGRAFHTLVGGAGLAELEEIKLIVEPAYQVVEAFRNVEPSPGLQQFFVDAAGHLGSCLQAYSEHSDWDEPLEFVAQADDLLATQGTAPRMLDQLLNAPVTVALFDAEPAFSGYLAAGRGGSDSASGNVQAVLHELANLATEVKAAPLAVLATALADALANAAMEQHLPDACAAVLRSAYDRLIDQLNEIAAGSDIALQSELIAQLATLDFNTAGQSPSDPPAAEAAPIATLEKSDIAELAEVDPDLVQVFFEEADEINEELEANIMSWSAERENRLYMENMLRGLHTLKGGARLCGLSQLGDMAHDFESVVIEVQTDSRVIDDALFVELNRRYDEIAKRLTEVNEELDQVRGSTVADNIVELAPVQQTPEPVPEPVVAPTSPTPVEISEPVVLPVQPVEPVAAQATPLVPAAAASSETQLPPQTVPEQKPAPAPGSESNERGQQEMVRVRSALLEDLVNLAGESSILRARIEQGMSDFTVALDEMEITIERVREQLRRLEIETETQILHRHERTDSPQYENFDPLEMDRYNQMQQLSRSLSESASDMTDLKETLLFKARESETLLLQQARINTELQEGLMRTRMVPFSRLMPRLRRIVRQVASELGKEIDFNVQNAEGELDRNLLERMVPALEHMLRNAVDHGIESAEMRRNFGKSATGSIDLRLTREGGDVVIEISDDGAGIDVEGVRAKAIERGLMAADADLSDEEVLQFVLSAGFTTAKTVTQISGRGVGLDVVHSEVKQLGGSVSILSNPGKGTRFVVRVPFTVSVNRALMVSVSDDLYAIPLNTIEGIVLLTPEQLQNLYKGEGKTFEYAGVPYRVRYLGQYLGREYHGPAGGQASIPVVLVRSGDQAVAIHVDLVQGSREIVVKSLGPQFAGVGGISGATILGDGSVVVILDLLALIRAQHHEGARRQESSFATRSGPRCVMVVDDSVTVRKVTSRLLERQGMDVLVAKDGVEAVAMLQERRPDVILLDIEMPRMDGFEVARQVRHDERLRNLPIVMISSRTGDKHKEHASQLGVNKFLGKPFQENELLATIDELVAPN